MKKKVLSFALALTLGLVAFAGCGKGSDSSASSSNGASASTEDKVIKVGASVTPHAEILEQIKEDLAADGW